jgi:hypothetical protein
MYYFKKHLAGLALVFIFFGGIYGHPNWWRDDYAVYHAPGPSGSNWYVYPGWLTHYYSNWPEKYAYPASLSSPHDPPWGFWYW